MDTLLLFIDFLLNINRLLNIVVFHFEINILKMLMTNEILIMAILMPLM